MSAQADASLKRMNNEKMGEERFAKKLTKENSRFLNFGFMLK